VCSCLVAEEAEDKSMIKFRSSKRNGRGLDQVSRYAEKAPKIVNMKMSPRTIITVSWVRVRVCFF
jgi:hypothetical protein